MDALGKLIKKIDYTTTTAVKVDLPPNCIMHNISVLVSTAFNAGGNDFVQIGTSASAAAYAQNINVAVAGKATVTMLAAATKIINTKGNSEIYIVYQPAGTAPTAGVAYVVIEFAQV
jgi:hypothetical protein